jgi:flavin reductase
VSESAVADEQRALFRRWPAGVGVLVAEVDGRRGGITISSLVSLSLSPPLAGVAIDVQASIHGPFRGAAQWAVSLLGGEQERLAKHFARSVPPIALWDGVEVLERDPRLLAGAAGWLVAQTEHELVVGDHTLFVGRLLSIEAGPAATSLVAVGGGYRAL